MAQDDPFTLDLFGSTALSSGLGLGVTAFAGDFAIEADDDDDPDPTTPAPRSPSRRRLARRSRRARSAGRISTSPAIAPWRKAGRIEPATT